MFQVLCVLLCGPVVRPGCPKNSATPTPKTKLARSGVRSSDEVINKVRNIVNGYKTVFKLLFQGVGMCAREQRNHGATAADTDQGETDFLSF